MSSGRRYHDQEIRQILDLAIGQEDTPAHPLPTADGLTLTELQEVGREVGVPADRMAEAVAAFEGRGMVVPRETALGLPSAVGWVVPLPRNPTDHEWELMIAELRTTFGGKGEVTSHGGLREWSHSRVHAFIEPTETGHRLRLTDANAAVIGIVAGGMMMAFATMIFMVLLGKADPGFRFVIPGFIALFGGGLAAGSALALPRWARAQEARMAQFGRKAVALLSAPRDPAGP